MFRILAVCLAIYIGFALSGQLWVVSLDAQSLTAALHGMLFLLLSLGLMGKERLSLVLSVLLCLPTLISDTPLSVATPDLIAQYVLFALSLFLLIFHQSHRRAGA